MATFKTADIELVRPEEVFTVECNSGEVYTLPHPKDVRAQDMIHMDTRDVVGTFMTILGDDYYDFVHEEEMTAGHLEAVLEAWLKHYDLPVSPGNGRASRRSSTATPKRSKPTSRGKASR